jgi:hypothetical protein
MTKPDPREIGQRAEKTYGNAIDLPPLLVLDMFKTVARESLLAAYRDVLSLYEANSCKVTCFHTALRNRIRELERGDE